MSATRRLFDSHIHVIVHRFPIVEPVLGVKLAPRAIWDNALALYRIEG